LLGCTMMEKYPGIEKTDGFKKFRYCMEERIPFHIENEFTFPDGTSSWFELRIEPVPEGIFILSADISERKQAEQAQQKMNDELEARVQERTMQLVSANKTLEKFSYSVSHDLRSPLRAIDGYAMLLEKEYTPILDTEGQRLLSVIRQNTMKMGRLIDDILEFARLGKAPVSKIQTDMNEIVQQIWQDMQSTASPQTIFTMETLLPAPADKSLISQVWVNIISNALKYSSKQETQHITIGSEAVAHEIIYYVTDNGTGFDMQYSHKLFAVFQRLHKQTEYEGTGVGLAIVDSIVQRHGGRVWAHSKPGEGATFYFSLPLNEQPAEE
jgi:light-regulated signal transduction histidine kinase (bacteriophytochrome)